MVMPGQVVDAVLIEAPSQTVRGGTETRLELIGGAPVQLEPPDAWGTEVVEATPAEWAALAAAGYALQPAK
jgi:hypothetical protein